MLRRLSSAPTTCVAAASAVLQQTRCGLPNHTPKSDVNLGRFSYEREYMEFRNKSARVPDYGPEKYRATYWRIDEHVRRSEAYIQNQGFFFLPTLEFPWYKGCMPLFSSYQIRVHYSRHHRAYVEKLNQLIEGTPLYGHTLDEIIVKTSTDPTQQAVFNNAAQHYNHSFFWKCIQPYGSNIPPDLKSAVEKQYGSVEEFQKKFNEAALGLFGSGWVYWVYDTTSKKFDIVSYRNAGCPLANNATIPLLCADVWEHTYYIDYENDRAAYMSKFFEVVDWHWAERHWKRATKQEYYEMKFW